jgi:catechol 2,3-dioxygenase-like lactoylglutathione lyase family enzyme
MVPRNAGPGVAEVLRFAQDDRVAGGVRMLGSIDVVAFVPTKDSEKARAFYVGVLGLSFVKDDGFALVLDANGIMVRVAKAQFTPAPFTILGWQVEDIEKMVTGLQAKGVQFERFGFLEQDKLGIWTAPSGDKVAWFKDPDGNILSVSQHV